jgi:hypothetical protein
MRRKKAAVGNKVPIVDEDASVFIASSSILSK